MGSTCFSRVSLLFLNQWVTRASSMLDTCWFDSFITSCRTSNGLCASADTSWGWPCDRGWRARRPPHGRAAGREGDADTARPRPASDRLPAAGFPSSRAARPAHRLRPESSSPGWTTIPASRARGGPRPCTRVTPRSHEGLPPPPLGACASGRPSQAAPAAPGGCGAQGEASGGAGVAGPGWRASSRPRAAPPARPRRFRPPPPARGPVVFSLAPTPAPLTSVPDSALWRSLHIVPKAPRTRDSTFPPPAALTTGGDVPASQGRPPASQRRSSAASEARVRAAPAGGAGHAQ